MHGSGPQIQELRENPDILVRADRPLSTNIIADQPGVDCHTVNKDLKEMEQQGEVERLEWQTNLILWWQV